MHDDRIDSKAAQMSTPGERNPSLESGSAEAYRVTRVVGGVVLGMLLTYVVATVTVAMTFFVAPWWLPRLLFVLPLAGLVVLFVPRWRRTGAGFVMGLAIGGIVLGGVMSSLTYLPQNCGQDVAVEEFLSLPPAPGVDVEVRRDPRFSECTGLISTPDADAVVAHYEDAMREAGWEVSTLEAGSVTGRGPIAGVILHHTGEHTGEQNGVRVLIFRSDMVKMDGDVELDDDGREIPNRR